MSYLGLDTNSPDSSQSQEIIDLKQTILNFIDDRIILIETTVYGSDFSDISDGRFLRHTKASEYIQNNDIRNVAQKVNSLAHDLLLQLRGFIEACVDLETLQHFSNGYSSQVFDFTKWDTLAAATQSAEAGENTIFQYSPELVSKIIDIVATTVHSEDLLEKLKAGKTKTQEVRKLILDGTPAVYSHLTGEQLPGLYEQFSKIFETIDSKLSVAEATQIFTEYVLAVKLISDVQTDRLVRDLFSNIFNRLAGYFSLVEFGEYAAQLQQNEPTPEDQGE